MDNKGINGSGVNPLWSKIKENFATKVEMQQSVAQLVPQSQISNLKFVESSTAPTVDDRSIITFVIEE